MKDRNGEERTMEVNEIYDGGKDMGMQSKDRESGEREQREEKSKSGAQCSRELLQTGAHLDQGEDLIGPALRHAAHHHDHLLQSR